MSVGKRMDGPEVRQRVSIPGYRWRRSGTMDGLRLAGRAAP